ncbi:MAG: hypothetical protein PHR77_11550 [Kiritimatiellae bacterium]|nr:hypothetical protein [Kiritimatiellia bacterium]MDD5520183.1 hypothetical protein [Kiritimatiellia bacterium]
MKRRFSTFCLVMGTVCIFALTQGNTATNSVSTQAVVSATSTQAVPSATSTQSVISATSTQAVPSITSTQAVSSVTSTQEVLSVATSVDTVPTSYKRLSFDEKKYAIAAAIQLLLPASGDEWDSGMGGEIQFKWWINDRWGWMFAAGYQSWKLSDTMPITMDAYFNPEFTAGDVTLAPLGVSLLYKIPRKSESRLSFILDGGIRYVFVQSDAEVTFDYVNHYGESWHINSPIAVDDKFMAVVNATADLNISERFSWFAGAGYQFDFGGDEETWLYQSIGSDISGAIVQTGLNLKF